MKVTNWKFKAFACLASCGLIGMSGAQECSADETLDFSGLGGNGTGIPDTYGDNLATTPNIGLTWQSAGDESAADGWDSYNTWDGRGEVGQTDFNQVNPISLFLTPDAPQFGVFVSSFEMDEFAGGGDSVINWSLLDNGSTLFSGTFDDFSTANDPADAGGRSLVVTGMDSSSALFGELELRLELVTGAASYQAVDNLTFGQVAIPEPTSAAALGLGLGALFMRRRKDS